MCARPRWQHPKRESISHGGTMGPIWSDSVRRAAVGGDSSIQSPFDPSLHLTYPLSSSFTSENVWSSSERISFPIPIVHEPPSWCVERESMRIANQAELTCASVGGCGLYRTKDGIFLGSSHEMVSCRCGAERPQSTSGKTLGIPKRRYVNIYSWILSLLFFFHPPSLFFFLMELTFCF